MRRKRDRSHERPLISGIVWLGIGLLWLGVQQRIVPPFEYSWPVILIIVGIAILVSNIVRRRSPSAPPNAPGTASHQ